MNFPLIRMYRLTPRGAGGLCCDEAGVALGAAELARAGADAKGRIHCEGRPSRELGRILTAAYGPRSEDAILRVHRGLIRAASAIEARELSLAGIETVLLSLPDPAPDALAKLAEAAELAKWRNGWENQPRVAAGQPGGGQWTDDDEPSADISFGPSTSGKDAELPIDDVVYRPATDAPQIVQDRGGRTDRPTISPVSRTFSRALALRPASAFCWRQ